MNQPVTDKLYFLFALTLKRLSSSIALPVVLSVTDYFRIDSYRR